MTFLYNLLSALIYLADTIVWAYSLVVIVACLISWVNPDPYNPIVRFLRVTTEPVLWRIRKYLPFTYVGGFDFSPIVLLILLYLIRSVVIATLGSALMSMVY